MTGWTTAIAAPLAACFAPAAVVLALKRAQATVDQAGDEYSEHWAVASLALPAFVLALCAAGARQCAREKPFLFASDYFGAAALSAAHLALLVAGVARLPVAVAVAATLADQVWVALLSATVVGGRVLRAAHGLAVPVVLAGVAAVYLGDGSGDPGESRQRAGMACMIGAGVARALRGTFTRGRVMSRHSATALRRLPSRDEVRRVRSRSSFRRHVFSGDAAGAELDRVFMSGAYSLGMFGTTAASTLEVSSTGGYALAFPVAAAVAQFRSGVPAADWGASLVAGGGGGAAAAVPLAWAALALAAGPMADWAVARRCSMSTYAATRLVAAAASAALADELLPGALAVGWSRAAAVGAVAAGFGYALLWVASHQWWAEHEREKDIEMAVAMQALSADEAGDVRGSPGPALLKRVLSARAELERRESEFRMLHAHASQHRLLSQSGRARSSSRASLTDGPAIDDRARRPGLGPRTSSAGEGVGIVPAADARDETCDECGGIGGDAMIPCAACRVRFSHATCYRGVAGWRCCVCVERGAF